MPSFKIKIQPRAFKEIQKGIDYYNAKQKGLGKRFYKNVSDSFAVIKKNPFYQIRYDDVRCLPVKKFPFMIHFTADKAIKTINVYAVINTSLNPETSWLIL